MATSKDLDYGLLAELSYVNFQDISLSKGNSQANSNWQDFAKNDISNKKRKGGQGFIFNFYQATLLSICNILSILS